MKNLSIVTIGILFLGTIAACLPMAIAGYTFSWTDGGPVARNPQAEAQATRIAIQAADESLARAIERQAAQASADAATAAQPAATAQRAMTSLAIGAGSLVLIVGAAFALVAWINKRATSVYPNEAGQYPVIVKRSWNGITIVHDPNRALGPTTIYSTPSPVGLLIKQPQQAHAEYPVPGSEQTMAQIATQAQAVGLMAAATRPQGLLAGNSQLPEKTEQLVRAIVSAPARLPATRLPTSDQWRVHVEQMLLEASND